MMTMLFKVRMLLNEYTTVDQCLHIVKRGNSSIHRLWQPAETAI
jgi:hypothetical protein